ncbi:hypothetical protein CNMCM5623_010096 [Aspergillus felis]|uniref:DUF7704 domain-containing protein n=1 Tax=Aspergillus felis TaxID=1287682 RepID=A0A8H6QUY6_9EURO|nr:hypothetical protein CNMCM5623_010096 [Aspergillus felis]KAF7179769.1 hypothetical protein CNMCM7691_008819 [Aspergillus felis]
MSTIFPTWPHILFAVIEPITLYVLTAIYMFHFMQSTDRHSIGGWALPFWDLKAFITDQIPGITGPEFIHPTSATLAFQLANVYGLLSILGIGICYSTTEPRVLRNYLYALAIADVGHIYVTYCCMGHDRFVDVMNWNVLTWGNVGVTGFLMINRIAYLTGLFGEAKGAANKIQKRGVKQVGDRQ